MNKTSKSVGFLLGSELSHCRWEFSESHDNLDALKKIIGISEAYKNFSTGGLPKFAEDFQAGYESTTKDIYEPEEQPEPSDPYQSWPDNDITPT